MAPERLLAALGPGLSLPVHTKGLRGLSALGWGPWASGTGFVASGHRAALTVASSHTLDPSLRPRSCAWVPAGSPGPSRNQNRLGQGRGNTRETSPALSPGEVSQAPAATPHHRALCSPAPGTAAGAKPETHEAGAGALRASLCSWNLGSLFPPRATCSFLFACFSFQPQNASPSPQGSSLSTPPPAQGLSRPLPPRPPCPALWAGTRLRPCTQHLATSPQQGSPADCGAGRERVMRGPRPSPSPGPPHPPAHTPFCTLSRTLLHTTLPSTRTVHA